MRSHRHSLALSTLVLLAWAWNAGAQVPVVDLGGAQGASPRATQQPAPGNSANQVLVELYMQLDNLQREVQNLRGIVEEQSYQLRRMETEQRDRYLDLDRRLSALESGNPTTRSTSPSASGNDPQGAGGDGTDLAPAGGLPQLGGGPGLPTTVAAPDAADAGPQGEQDLYRNALNLLLEQEQYEESVSLFQQYLANYPDGNLAANAWYWLGEALILVNRYNEARDAFMTVMNEYPDDPKAAGAMLKLGVVYSRMGETQMARELWQRIPQEYPQSTSEIRFAQDYLSQAN